MGSKLQTYIESLIFVATKPISKEAIRLALNDYLTTSIKVKEVETILGSIMEKYQDETYPFEVREIANGFAFMTKGAFHELNGKVLKRENKKKLTRTALETLSIIAYKQPVTKGDIESIRGVSSDYTIQKLMEKELIEISGRAETLGRPLLYTTSEKFMNHFGLKSINDLPKLKEFKLEQDEQGEQRSDSESE